MPVSQVRCHRKAVLPLCSIVHPMKEVYTARMASIVLLIGCYLWDGKGMCSIWSPKLGRRHSVRLENELEGWLSWASI